MPATPLLRGGSYHGSKSPSCCDWNLVPNRFPETGEQFLGGRGPQLHEPLLMVCQQLHGGLLLF